MVLLRERVARRGIGAIRAAIIKAVSNVVGRLACHCGHAGLSRPDRPDHASAATTLKVAKAGSARPYRSGRSAHWIKVKNPKAPAVTREAEEDWG